LPFVPTYQLKVQVVDAANLVRGNDVRIAGSRVGVVDKIGTKELPNGQVIAVLDLKLETTVEKLPKDSTVLIRPRSALGLKYVQITQGTSKDGYENGGTVPLRQATPQPLAEGIRDFPQQRPFLQNSTVLFKELAPGVRALRAALPDLSAAVTAGTPALARSPALNERLADVFVSLRDFATDPIPTIAL